MIASVPLLFFAVLLLLTVFLEPLASRFRIPFALVLIVLGFAGSEILVRGPGLDTGIHWENFQLIILQVFLPVIIFRAALKLDIRRSYRELIPLLLLALPLMLAAVLITAAVLYYGIGYPGAFSWHTAVLAGALLSSTDPSALVPILKKYGAPDRLVVLLEGEGLFSDVTAVALFLLLLGMAPDGPVAVEWQTLAPAFIKVFLGGVATGLAAAGVVYICARPAGGRYVYALVTLIAVYGAFVVATDLLGCSGVVAVLTLGLVLGSVPVLKSGLETGRFTGMFWEFSALVIDRLVYLLAGVTITVAMFTEQWLAMILGIAAVVIARAVSTMVLLPLFCYALRVEKLSKSELFVLEWGGVRGTVTMALALSLPLTQQSWFTLQSIAYGVVLYTLFVQLTTMGPLLRHLKISHK